jgi:hypothetical protein
MKNEKTLGCGWVRDESIIFAPTPSRMKCSPLSSYWLYSVCLQRTIMMTDRISLITINNGKESWKTYTADIFLILWFRFRFSHSTFFFLLYLLSTFFFSLFLNSTLSSATFSCFFCQRFPSIPIFYTNYL